MIDSVDIIKGLNASGYTQSVQIAETLQGSIWRSVQQSTNESVVIKVTEKSLHKTKSGVVNGQICTVHENIKKEMSILKRLAKDEKCPNSIVKYRDSFMSKKHYFFVMEDGGQSLFDFIIKAHRCVAAGQVAVAEWHSVCKIMMKQMIESIEYLHRNNVCHLDISLENFLINDVAIMVQSDGTLNFRTESIQIKLCDFGVAEVFNGDFKCKKYCGKSNYKSPEVMSRINDGFCAKSNDIWCLGISFFMMITGTAPWKCALKSDKRFVQIMRGNIAQILSRWKMSHLVNRNILDLFMAFFTFEELRVSLNELKCSSWLQYI